MLKLSEIIASKNEEVKDLVGIERDLGAEALDELMKQPEARKLSVTLSGEDKGKEVEVKVSLEDLIKYNRIGLSRQSDSTNKSFFQGLTLIALEDEEGPYEKGQDINEDYFVTFGLGKESSYKLSLVYGNTLTKGSREFESREEDNISTATDLLLFLSHGSKETLDKLALGGLDIEASLAGGIKGGFVSGISILKSDSSYENQILKTSKHKVLNAKEMMEFEGFKKFVSNPTEYSKLGKASGLLTEIFQEFLTKKINSLIDIKVVEMDNIFREKLLKKKSSENRFAATLTGRASSSQHGHKISTDIRVQALFNKKVDGVGFALEKSGERELTFYWSAPEFAMNELLVRALTKGSNSESSPLFLLDDLTSRLNAEFVFRDDLRALVPLAQKEGDSPKVAQLFKRMSLPGVNTSSFVFDITAPQIDSIGLARVSSLSQMFLGTSGVNDVIRLSNVDNHVTNTFSNFCSTAEDYSNNLELKIFFMEAVEEMRAGIRTNLSFQEEDGTARISSGVPLAFHSGRGSMLEGGKYFFMNEENSRNISYYDIATLPLRFAGAKEIGGTDFVQWTLLASSRPLPNVEFTLGSDYSYSDDNIKAVLNLCPKGRALTSDLEYAARESRQRLSKSEGSISTEEEE